MKKLKLNLDELKVESFKTSSEKEENKGTVQGNLPWTETCEGAPTCELQNTCWYTCARVTGPCYGTCYIGCPYNTPTCGPDPSAIRGCDTTF